MAHMRTIVAAIAAFALLPITMLVATTPAAAVSCGGFNDVDSSNPFCQDIRWLSANDVAQGYDDGGFHPRATVSRQAMAGFLYRLAYAGRNAPGCSYGEDPFPDVDENSTFCRAIEWLAAQSVTGGYRDRGFHPRASVTRQAMAAFMYRMVHPVAPAEPCTSRPFKDVPVGNPFCAAIQWVVDRGVTEGYRDGGFHPRARVTRQAMAAFMHRLDPDRTLRPSYRVYRDGIFRVGTDIEPGTYRTRTNAKYCAWYRLSGFSGAIEDTIEIGLSDGPAVVTIKPSDKGFKTDGCGLWTRNLSQVSVSKVRYFDDGTWIVGTDIKPGTYRTRRGTDLCSWQRLSGFSGEFDDYIAGDLTSGPAVVTIKRSDKGFKTEGCALWTINLSQVSTSKVRYIDDGTWIVGTDIKPGTYRTRRGTDLCSWQRLSGFSGEFDDYIAGDLTSGPAVVTIKRSDKGFKTEGCALWTINLSQVSTSKTHGIGDGTWIVGTDMRPGTWKANGGEYCTWQRLSGFSGEFDDYIAGGWPSGSAIVTIKRSDEGFSTNGCGKWHRIG